jgi:hypothetical protein
MKLLLAIIFTLFLMGISQAQPIRFIAFGDMPYSAQDEVRYKRLIQAINQTEPNFSISVGDIKSGSTLCSDANNHRAFLEFQEFNGPVIYALGDNEWTDCHREAAGSFNPLERLNALRMKFFSSNQSLGKNKLTLIRQADLLPQFKAYVENSYWIQNQFLFVSLNIPGSNNNFERNLESVQEYFQRNFANLAWIDHAFQLAKKQALAGIVFAYQGDMFYNPAQAINLSSGYRDTLMAIRNHAEIFNKPILLIHGDSHRLKIDQPLMTNNQKYVLENVFRLQLMGADQVQAVEITIDNSKMAPFSFRPLIVRANSQH